MAKRKSLSWLHLLASERGWICHAKEYLGSSIKVGWTCQKGHVFQKSPSIVAYGEGCPDCSPTKKLTLGALQAYAATLGGLCLATEYKNNKEKVLWQCKLGHKWLANAHNVLGKNRTWCPVCAFDQPNPDLTKARMTQYRLDNKERLQAKKKEYYQTNKESTLIRSKEYYKSNKELILAQGKEYRQTNRELIQAKKKDYYKANKQKINKHKFKLYHTNIQHKIAMNLRNRLRAVLKSQNARKTSSAVRDLGCTIDELKKHLESQFHHNPRTGEVMSWENHSTEGWHIDHIKPLSSFDLTDPEQQKAACHYTNLQPLWAFENLSKGDRQQSPDNNL